MQTFAKFKIELLLLLNIDADFVLLNFAVLKRISNKTLCKTAV